MILPTLSVIHELNLRAQLPIQERLPHQQYNFQGFFLQNHTKWSNIIFHWLPNFDPLIFLSRRINSEPPTGEAKRLWVQCVKALTNLMSQTELSDAEGNYASCEVHDQLTMIARCLPILLLRVPKFASHKSKEQTMRPSRNCNLFLRGSWPSLTQKAVRELTALNTSATSQKNLPQPSGCRRKFLKHDKIQSSHEPTSLSRFSYRTRSNYP